MVKLKKKPEPSLEEKRKRWIQLGWRLIEWKIGYYYPEKVHESWGDALIIEDDEFDLYTREYLELCIALDEPNTVCHSMGGLKEDRVDLLKGEGMMEVDFTRPSVKLVMKKYGRKKP